MGAIMCEQELCMNMSSVQTRVMHDDFLHYN